MYEKYNIFPIDLSTVKYTADASVEVCVCLYNLRYVFFSFTLGGFVFVSFQMTTSMTNSIFWG